MIDIELYQQIFFPAAIERKKYLQAHGGKLAYYTDAETAIKILKNREVWMRDTRVMNDANEVWHGFECLFNALAKEGSPPSPFEDALNSVHSGVAEDIKSHLRAWAPGLIHDTYITCLSEHSPADYAYGRLSMWRAYGGKAGVALIFNSNFLNLRTTALAAYSSPVYYFGPDEVKSHLASVAANISNNIETLKECDRSSFVGMVFQMLRFLAVCTKHPAFREEQEWRIISSPAIEKGDILQPAYFCLGGIPQQILKIPLRNVPDQQITGIAPAELVEKILVGPCEYSDTLFQPLCAALSDAEVEDPGSKIRFTNIPLRQNQR